MMYICSLCFLDKFLQGWIRRHGQAGNCDYCGNECKVIADFEAAKKIRPICELYQPIIEKLYIDHFDENLGQDFLGNILTFDWEIFHNTDIANDFLENVELSDGGKYISARFAWGEEDDLAHSQSLIDEWNSFCEEIKNASHFFSKKFPKRQFDWLIKHSTVKIEPGSVFFRARIGKWDSKNDISAPPPDKTEANRMSPQGISYWYLAEEKSTCIREIHAGVAETVTIGKFNTFAPLKIIDLTKNSIFMKQSPIRLGKNLKKAVQMKDFIEHIYEHVGTFFPDLTKNSEYLPLQYLAEYIKTKGFDGVKYSSARDKNGVNLAMFSGDKLEFVPPTEHLSIDL